MLSMSELWNCQMLDADYSYACLDVPWTVVCLCRSVLHKSVSTGSLASDDVDDGLLELTS